MRWLAPFVWSFSVGDVFWIAALFAVGPILTLAGWLARRRAARFGS